MASQALRPAAGSGKAKPSPSPSPAPGLFIDKIVFIPGGNDGGNVGPPPGFGDGGSTETPVNSVQNTPTPTLASQPPPPPPPSTPSPSPQSVNGSPPSKPAQKSPNPLPHFGSSGSSVAGPHSLPTPASTSADTTSSQDTQDNDPIPVTDVPLPTQFTGILPLSAPQETAVAVSSCEGTDSCVTVSGKTFSLLPTPPPSSSSGPISASMQSVFNPSSVFDPSIAFNPTVTPQNLGRELQSPFDRQPFTIILISTTVYFILSIASIAGAFSILRRRRRRSHVSIRVNDGLRDTHKPSNIG